MSIEPETLVQIINLSPECIMDLINTVDTAIIINRQLISSPEDRTAVALVMLSHAQTLLELCGCKIKAQITNPGWTSKVTYETGVDNVE